MKFLEAKKMGIKCGLETPAEWVNNVLIHCTMLFEYSEIEKEEKELIDDAIKNGVLFSRLCRHATKENINELCYMCKAVLKLETDERYRKEYKDDY